MFIFEWAITVWSFLPKYKLKVFVDSMDSPAFVKLCTLIKGILYFKRRSIVDKGILTYVLYFRIKLERNLFPKNPTLEKIILIAPTLSAYI